MEGVYLDLYYNIGMFVIVNFSFERFKLFLLIIFADQYVANVYVILYQLIGTFKIYVDKRVIII